MENFSEYWNLKLVDNLKKSTYEPWLESFKYNLIDTGGLILDLGCGNGEDTEWLIENGFDVVSVDFSENAVNRVKLINSNTKLFDISNISDWKRLKDKSFSVVIANLSLHYFDDKTTKMIMNEISRILIDDGILIARVNSNLDKEFGAGAGIEIEPNFYRNLDRGIDKRFFTQQSANEYFSIIGKANIELKTIKYIGKQKQIFEIVVNKQI